jgi:hypothetical protein
MLASGALSAVDYSKASSLALARYKWLQGTAGGVGESSSVDCLTDVPEFRQVRHRRKSFTRVPRTTVLRRSLPHTDLVNPPSTRRFWPVM